MCNAVKHDQWTTCTQLRTHKTYVLSRQPFFSYRVEIVKWFSETWPKKMGEHKQKLFVNSQTVQIKFFNL